MKRPRSPDPAPRSMDKRHRVSGGANSGGANSGGASLLEKLKACTQTVDMKMTRDDCLYVCISATHNEWQVFPGATKYYIEQQLFQYLTGWPRVSGSPETLSEICNTYGREKFWNTLHEEILDEKFQMWKDHDGQFFIPRQSERMETGLIMDFRQGTVRPVDLKDHVPWVQDNVRSTDDQRDRDCTWTTGRSITCDRSVEYIMNMWWRPCSSLIKWTLDRLLGHAPADVSKWPQHDIERQVQKGHQHVALVLDCLITKLFTPVAPVDLLNGESSWIPAPPVHTFGIPPDAIPKGMDPTLCTSHDYFDYRCSTNGTTKKLELVWITQINTELSQRRLKTVLDFPHRNRCDLLIWFLQQRQRLQLEERLRLLMSSVLPNGPLGIVSTYL